MISSLRKQVRQFLDRLFGDICRRHDIENLYSQFSALLQVHALLPSGAILMPLRKWAISPDALLHVALAFKSSSPNVIVEFGSGQSTVVLAALFNAQGKGRLVSVEHDGDFAETVRAQLKASGLSEWVELQVVPLVSVGDEHASQTYDLQSLRQERVDLVLVDGPPMLLGPLARYAPLEWAVRHVTPLGSIFLDDANRAEEAAIVKQLLRENSMLQHETIDCEKGLCRFWLDGATSE